MQKTDDRESAAIDDGVLVPEPFEALPGLSGSRPEMLFEMASFALESASDAVFWLASDGRIVFANRAACELTGFAREQLLAMSITDIDEPLARGELDEKVNWQRLREHRALRFESTHRTRDGRVLPVEISANFMSIDGLELSCAFVRDISERRCVLQALETSRQRFSDLVNTIDGVVWEADADTFAFTFISNQASALFGYPLSRWREPGFWVESIHPEDREWVVAYCAEATRRLESHSFDYRVVCRKGEVRWIRDIVAVVAENGVPRFLRGVMLDITERHRAEEKLRFLAGVFEHAHEGIMITDTQPRILDVNPAFSAITGYSHDEVIGCSPNLLAPEGPDGECHARMWQHMQTDGFWRGELWSRHRNDALFPELRSVSAVHDHRGAVHHYVVVFSDISQIKEHQQRLEQMAHYDALTHLPNRALLADRLMQAVAHADRHQRMLVVCYLDLDGFKPVNDAYGHEAGDRLLIEVAQRLKATVRADDTVARLGGDEFVLLLGGQESSDGCERTLQRLLHAIAQTFDLGRGVRVSLSGSMGVTLYPDDCVDADTLLRHADQALYVAKQRGRNRYHFFDLEHERRNRVRHEILQQIERALAQGELRLHYQPKVNLRTGRVLGTEALIRWQHPERGLLSPAAFLPLIEDSELVARIGDWVLGESFEQMHQWWRQGRHLSMSINIAVYHLTQPNFVQRLAGWLERYPRLDPAMIELEILETAALDDIAKVSALIEQCRQLGVRFSLDDFGTGYSSLTYLRRLPADVLKIDQSFVEDMLVDPDDLTIVDGVIGLTRAFDRGVVAEGVESGEHGVLLLQLGCEIAQGFGIARPMPPEAVPAWLKHYRPDPLWQSLGELHWPRESLPMLVASMDLHRALSLRLSAARAGRPEPPEHLPAFRPWVIRHGIDSDPESQMCKTLLMVHRRIVEVDACWCEECALDAQWQQSFSALCDTLTEALVRWHQLHFEAGD